MSQSKDHNQVVREAFTAQAVAYAANPLIADPERIARLVRAVQPTANDRVLEVATGPGYVAMGFAAVAREVIGVDLTPAPLAYAEQRRQELGIDNVHFRTADAAQLPFAAEEFTIVLCRLAFHHFPDAARVLREMRRVCAPQGAVVVEDLMVSAHAQRAAYHNHFENLRDPSHTAAFALRDLLSLFTDTGLEIEQVSTSTMLQVAEQWLANAHTPAAQAAEVRRLLADDARDDLSGTYPHQNAAGQWCFTQRLATVVGRKLR